MISASKTNTGDEPARAGNDTRVLDSGRALSVMAGGVLVAGFVALRMLAGDSEAPTVEAQIDEGVQAPPAATQRDDTIHRLRPQTSSTLPAANRLHSADSAIAPSSRWTEAPASFFAPIDQSEASDFSDVEIARQNELVR